MANTHYTGKAGQLSVMAELSLRGYNVAIPEIDIGDDVFVLNDNSGQLTRLQVKTATGKRLKRSGGYRCQFNIKVAHVRNAASGGSHYILADRCGSRWRHLVMEKGILRHLIDNGWSTDAGNGVRILSVIFLPNAIAQTSTRATGKHLSPYLSNWAAWPERN